MNKNYTFSFTDEANSYEAVVTAKAPSIDTILEVSDMSKNYTFTFTDYARIKAIVAWRVNDKYLALLNARKPKGAVATCSKGL